MFWHFDWHLVTILADADLTTNHVRKNNDGRLSLETDRNLTSLWGKSQNQGPPWFDMIETQHFSWIRSENKCKMSEWRSRIFGIDLYLLYRPSRLKLYTIEIPCRLIDYTFICDNTKLEFIHICITRFIACQCIVNEVWFTRFWLARYIVPYRIPVLWFCREACWCLWHCISEWGSNIKSASVPRHHKQAHRI